MQLALPLRREAPIWPVVQRAAWVLALSGVVLRLFWIWGHPVGGDASAYWSVWQGEMYPDLWRIDWAYVYSPAFAQAIWPLTLLSFGAFYVVWGIISAGSIVAAAGLWGALAFTFAYPVFRDAQQGNINGLVTLAIMLSFRWPATWAFVLLTKVTPGVGLLWYVVRREWRSLATALGVTAAVVVVSGLFAPHLWVAWIEQLVGSTAMPTQTPWSSVPLSVRLPIAALIVVIGARLGYRWTLPISVFFAMPAIWHHTPAVLVAVIPLAIRDFRESRWGRDQDNAPRSAA